ncbi:Uncharacterised protein [Bordetella pertussis]|nr:Uncharacterised protein [Bordetella pertussis]
MTRRSIRSSTRLRSLGRTRASRNGSSVSGGRCRPCSTR